MTKFALVSVVIPVLNESACLRQLHAELRGVCDRLPYAFEFVFVDDGSTDGTADVLRQLSELDERVRYLVLSRNFGHQPALSAGLRKKTVTLVPSARLALVVPRPRSHRPKCSSS